MILVNAAIATFHPGTVNFTGGTGLIVDEFCSVEIQPEPTVDVTFNHPLAGTGDTLNWIKPGGRITVKGSGGGTWDSRNAPLSNEGGTFRIEGGATAWFGGPDFAVAMSDPQALVMIENGCKIKINNKMVVGSGKLATVATAQGEQKATIESANQTVFIGGAGLTPEVVINDPAFNPPGVTGHKFGTLQMSTNLVWRSGTYRPFLDEAVNGGVESTESDKWICTGTVTVRGGPLGVRFGPVSYNPPTPPATVRVGRTWLVLEGQQGIALEDPQFPAEVVGPWAVDPVPGNPVTQWRMKRTA
jgi:hypothetical protein